MNDTRLTSEQIEEIALNVASLKAERVPDWQVEEENAQRDDILVRVRERVETVMNFERMSSKEMAAYVIEKEDELAEMREMIRTLLVDPLTGLNVRRFYEETVPRAIEGEASEVAMLMIDADHFKNINDTFGHPAGDFVLKEIGKIIHQLFRKRDIKVRYGGEELVVVMPGCGLKIAREKAELLRQTIEKHEFVFHPHGGVSVLIEPVRVSIGVSELSLLDEKGTPDELKTKLEKRADLLVYAAKDLGRNTVATQNAFDMEKLRKRKEKEEGKILPTAATTTTEAASGESTGESASTTPRA